MKYWSPVLLKRRRNASIPVDLGTGTARAARSVHTLENDSSSLIDWLWDDKNWTSSSTIFQRCHIITREVEDGSGPKVSQSQSRNPYSKGQRPLAIWKCHWWCELATASPNTPNIFKADWVTNSAQRVIVGGILSLVKASKMQDHRAMMAWRTWTSSGCCSFRGDRWNQVIPIWTLHLPTKLGMLPHTLNKSGATNIRVWGQHTHAGYCCHYVKIIC